MGTLSHDRSCVYIISLFRVIINCITLLLFTKKATHEVHIRVPWVAFVILFMLPANAHHSDHQHDREADSGQHTRLQVIAEGL